MGVEYAWLHQGISGRWSQVRGILLFLLYAVLGVAAGRSTVGGLAPFAVPLAVTAALLPTPLDWAVVIGVAAGVFTHAGAGHLLLPVGSALAVIVAFLLTRSLRDRIAPSLSEALTAPAGDSGRPVPGQSLLSGSLVAGGVNILVNSIFLLWFSRDSGALLNLISESVLASLFTPIALYGFTDVVGWAPTTPFRRRGAHSTVPAPGHWRGETEGTTGAVGTAVGDVRSGELHLGPVALRELLVCCVLITVAYAWGAGWGAGAGRDPGAAGWRSANDVDPDWFLRGHRLFCRITQRFWAYWSDCGLFFSPVCSSPSFTTMPASCQDTCWPAC